MLKRFAAVILFLLPLSAYAQVGPGPVPYRGVNNWNLIFGTDNTYDIGAVGASRPRNIYAGTAGFFPALTVSGLTSTRVPVAGVGGLFGDFSTFTFTSGTGTVSATNFAASSGVTAASVTDSGLTSGRVTLASTAGLLADDADLTFSGSRLTATDLTVTNFPTFSAGTNTRVPFFGASGVVTDDADMTFSTDTLSVTKGVFSSALTIPAGSTAATGTLLGNDTDTWIGSAAVGAVSLYCNNAECFRAQAAGTGIGLLTQPVTVGASGTASRLIQTAANGGSTEITTATALVTLNTGSTTTDTASIIPANSVVIAVTYRVTTAITTAVSFSIGDTTTATRFVNGATGVTLGSTGVGLQHMQGSVSTDAAGPVYTSASVVRITTNANPGAGAIRVQVWYRIFTPPTS